MLPLALAGLAAAAAPAAARDYGQQGTVWAITEPDLLAQIHARLAALEASGETKKLNERLKQRTIARVNRPSPVAGLVRAEAPRSWLFDPTITVAENITDDKGRVVIAAGTRVNPLDSVPLRQALVFLDGDDPEQLAWATRTYASTKAKFILVAGAPLELMKARQRRFWFDQEGKLVRRFGIRAVPAVVEQQGRQLQVREHALPPKRDGRP
ncbi:type-F conjugative transfer system protein TraW [Croceicoccus marinus]|uniref:Type-F conjugative transfer system protein TraW n=1 Tax=Croceicoccus marinus TaxID=450378 RepID=A0A1Z1F8C0_9SPHN|nr:type-F conjugative transfer system protein TraW [Croceicoccus marinus]ARU14982.1 type-F conjugative transfer system protein TraW [Croceicoccus marinus]